MKITTFINRPILACVLSVFIVISGQAIEAIREVAEKTLPSGYGYDFGTMTREEAKTGNSSTWIFAICVVFIYLILVALYENLLFPFAVILSVPFGLAGSFLLPMVFATGVGSNGSRSLAIGVIGGMILGTIALFYITPAIHIQLIRRSVL